jgi:hypothetical protein
MTSPSITPTSKLRWDWINDEGEAQYYTRNLNPNEISKIDQHTKWFGLKRFWSICRTPCENPSLIAASQLDFKKNDWRKLDNVTRLRLIYDGKETDLDTPCTFFTDHKGNLTSQVKDQKPVAHGDSVVYTFDGGEDDDNTTLGQKTTKARETDDGGSAVEEV